MPPEALEAVGELLYVGRGVGRQGVRDVLRAAVSAVQSAPTYDAVTRVMPDLGGEGIFDLCAI
jgi:hypothetical protein